MAVTTTYNPFGSLTVGQDNPYQQQWQWGGQQANELGKQNADTARLGVTYGQDLRQNRFNQVFPWLQGQLGSLTSGGGLATAGGQSPPSPEITVGGVWNPQQVQQQVNSARATSDQTTANRVRSIGQDTASRGFGSSSPLLQALQGQAYAANLGTNTANEREIRNNAAQQNSQQLLSTQSARENQFANRQKESIERTKPYWQTMNSLIGALGGLV